MQYPKAYPTDKDLNKENQEELPVQERNIQRTLDNTSLHYLGPNGVVSS